MGLRTGFETALKALRDGAKRPRLLRRGLLSPNGVVVESEEKSSVDPESRLLRSEAS